MVGVLGFEEADEARAIAHEQRIIAEACLTRVRRILMGVKNHPCCTRQWLGFSRKIGHGFVGWAKVQRLVQHLKTRGLNGGEAHRLDQYTSKAAVALEQLSFIKEYRTPLVRERCVHLAPPPASPPTPVTMYT